LPDGSTVPSTPERIAALKSQASARDPKRPSTVRPKATDPVYQKHTVADYDDNEYDYGNPATGVRRKSRLSTRRDTLPSEDEDDPFGMWGIESTSSSNNMVADPYDRHDEDPYGSNSGSKTKRDHLGSF